ncbi:sulfotransferase domain-containing protein [Winogradskyella sp. PG-2]|uniref:sulfotransferase domain-containing protein n=1 Tax=Winogradskyella sp. PG-2 TaxID=754409 RepID=UPI0004589513|nr:sulfotransferase domain-containing protein [Winogradskyella sp. PG-2]BAO76194.1 sulfotransferase [Winogradskyella sp. PG-2]
MNFPNFIVAGVAKCGTSSLCNYLNLHPDVFMTKPKELNFFGREGVENKLEAYGKHFEGSEGKIAGEGSVSYMLYSKLAAQQIKTYIPNVKLIVMLRNPLDRFYSDFWYNVNRGAVVYQKGLFEGVIDNTIRVNDSKARKMSYRESLISKGDYATHLKDYFKHINRDQIKIIFFEDFKKDRQAVLDSVFEFIGVKNANIEVPNKIYNKTMYPGKLNFVYTTWKKIKPLLPQKWMLKHKSTLIKLKSTFFSDKKPKFDKNSRSKLLAIYKDSIHELELMLDKDLSHWK